MADLTVKETIHHYERTLVKLFTASGLAREWRRRLVRASRTSPAGHLASRPMLLGTSSIPMASVGASALSFVVAGGVYFSESLLLNSVRTKNKDQVGVGLTTRLMSRAASRMCRIIHSQ